MPSYYARLCDKSLLRAAWKKISKTNKFSRGFDRVTIEEFAAHLDENLESLARNLKSRDFHFIPARGVLLDKEGGKKRPIKVPAVRDRVVLKAVQLIIAHRFEKYNLPCSYGYVENRSVADAIRAVRQLKVAGLKWVLEGDISHFFDTVNRDLLIQRFIREIRARSLLELLEEALQVEIGNAEDFSPDDRELFPAGDSGIPQGGVLSPMLANFYLYDFDTALTDAGYRLVRYADDFVVMCATEREAELAFDLCKEVLENRLGLKIHDLRSPNSKSKITLYSKGFTFLGIRFEGEKIYPSPKSIKRFEAKIAEIANPEKGRNLLETLTKLRNLLVGWGKAYSSCDTERYFQELDQFVNNSISSFLRSYGFLKPGVLLGKKQRKLLGIPSLMSIRKN